VIFFCFLAFPVNNQTSTKTLGLRRRENKMLKLSQRDRAAGCFSFGQKWKTETIFYGHYRSIFNHCKVKVKANVDLYSASSWTHF